MPYRCQDHSRYYKVGNMFKYLFVPLLCVRVEYMYEYSTYTPEYCCINKRSFNVSNSMFVADILIEINYIVKMQVNCFSMSTFSFCY